MSDWRFLLKNWRAILILLLAVALIVFISIETSELIGGD
jgi:hypothetical protein